MLHNRIFSDLQEQASNCLVCIGLDTDDGHTRFTQASEFCIFGGSTETHQLMTEAFCMLKAALQKEGRSLENLEPDEILALVKQYIS